MLHIVCHWGNAAQTAGRVHDAAIRMARSGALGPPQLGRGPHSRGSPPSLAAVQVGTAPWKVVG